MIDVIIMHRESNTELGRIIIENVSTQEDEAEGSYSVRFAVDRCGAVGVHQRGISHFPRLRYNVLALLLQALNTLDESELKLTDGTRSSNLARRFRGIGSAIQSWTD